ncbi:MAG TPA: BON domain-containing protein [Thermomicrobiales bacterium]|jgi:osmotically-inducible protein OsmY|nr:BON domain-containing protein [Thermomicrobiales bacterium]
MSDTGDIRTSSAIADLAAHYDRLEMGIAAEVADGELVLTGVVDSDESRQAAVDLAQPFADDLGLRVNVGIDVEVVGPEGAFEDDDRAAQGFGDIDSDVILGRDPDERDGSDEGNGYDSSTDTEVLSLEQDFQDDAGTTNVIDVVENGATYIAPNDPPTARADDEDGFAVLGGFSQSSTDAIAADADLPDDDTRRLPTDDELADIVRRELREDSLTTDLPIHVSARGSTVVLRGEVDTLADAEAAESVANEVPAVVEVREELTIRGITQGERPERP